MTENKYISSHLALNVESNALLQDYAPTMSVYFSSDDLVLSLL